MKITLFQGIVLGVCALAGIIGVAVFSFYRPEGGTAGVGSVLIWGSIPEKGVHAALENLRRADQTFGNVTYVDFEPNQLPQELVAAIAQGTPPDLVLASHEHLSALAPYVRSISVERVSERTFKDAFTAGGEIFLLPDGSGSLGLPILIDPLVLFYNRTMLSSAGIVRPPLTWDELSGHINAVVTRTPSGGIDKSLVAFGTYANVQNARGILSSLFMQLGAPLSVIVSTGQPRADLGTRAESGIPPAEAVVRFYTQFADPSKSLYSWNAGLEGSQERFLQGDLAFYLGYASEVGHLREANPNLDFDVAVLPQYSERGTKATYGHLYAFMIPKGAKNHEGGFQVAVALTQVGNNQLLALHTLRAPAVRGALAHRPSDAVSAIAYDSALFTRGWLSPGPAETDSVFSAMINDVNSGRLSITRAVALAESALTALFAR